MEKPLEKPLEKPTPPASHECCGGGSCCPCVWDRYYENFRQWQRQHGEVASPSAKDVKDTKVVKESPIYR